MTHKQFADLLTNWQQHVADVAGLTTKTVSVHKDDSIKLDALAEVYQLPVDTIVAELLHRALLSIEEEMPYIEGDRVIRVEEGNNIYDDIGPTPKYLAAMKRIRENQLNVEHNKQ